MNNREEFEAWAEPELYALDKREGSDIYRNVITRNAWIGWQAALASQQDHIGVTDEMAYSFHRAITDGSLSASEVEEIKIGLRAALANHIPDVGKMVQSQAQQEPSKDIHEAITLLSAVFDAWENGTDCYDDFDGVSGSFIGKAFNLDDEIFKRCCDLLNRVNPPRNVSQAQQESQWISVEEAKATLKDGDLLFAYCEFYGVVEATYAFEEGYYNPHRIVKNNGDSYRINTFTHFMARKPESLPPAPEGEKK